MYQKILSMNNEELKIFVENRKNELESVNKFDTLPAHIKGYIPSETKITISNDSSSFYTADGIDYYDYITYIKNNVNDSSIGSLLIYTVQYIQDYFNFDPTIKKEDNRELYIKDNNSITAFKGINEAKCLELAILFQNLFSFIGLDIELFKLYGIKENGEKIAHAINVINVGDMHIYFDLSIREIQKNSDGSITYNPTIRELSLEDYNNLKNNEVLKIRIKNDLYGFSYEEISFVRADFLSGSNQKKLSRNA